MSPHGAFQTCRGCPTFAKSDGPRTKFEASARLVVQGSDSLMRSRKGDFSWYPSAVHRKIRAGQDQPYCFGTMTVQRRPSLHHSNAMVPPACLINVPITRVPKPLRAGGETVGPPRSAQLIASSPSELCDHVTCTL